MATIQRSNISYFGNWENRIAWNVASSSSTSIRLTNSDGTFTIVTGSGFALTGGGEPVSGTVTQLELRQSDNTTVLTTLTGVSVALTSFRTNLGTALGTTLNGNDTFNGGSGTDLFNGFAGDDVFNPGATTGSDVMTGGAGNDTFNGGPSSLFLYIVSYARETGGGGVTVNLAAGTATDTFGNTDTFNGPQTVIATNQVDSLTGSNFDDFLSPGGGTDSIDGGLGFDHITYNFNSAFNSDSFGFPANGITVTFTAQGAGTIIDPFGNTDTFVNVERVRGTNHADTYNGGPGDDSFTGMAGADAFHGGLGSDEISYGGEANGGGVGAITIDLGNGTATDSFGNADTFDGIERAGGTAQGDTMIGSGDANTLRGFGGTDTLFGLGNNDLLDGGTGADAMTGGAGDDTYVVDDAGDGIAENASEGTDTVQTTLGSYALGANVENLTFTDNALHVGFGNTLANVMIGGGGSDTLVAHTVATIFAAEQDSLSGGNGDDTLYGEGADILNGGIGFDILQVINDFAVNLDLAAAGIEYVLSGFGNDVYTAATTSVATEVYGGGGNDQITGGSGNDSLWAGVGNDTLVGNGGNDLLVGDLGADSLSGGSGTDRLYIDSDDTFIDGGADFDAAYIATGSGVTINLATTQIEWVADFAGGNDVIDGSGSSVNLEIYAEGGTDSVTGGTGADLFWGGSGNDTLTGNGGTDTLVGGTGADTLTGGTGTDALYANSGGGADGALDTLVFTDGWGTDFVFDFEVGIDKLDLTAVTGVNSFGDLTLTDTPDGHCYVTFGGNLIAIAGMAGQITQSDFLL